jgi:glycosyltransferase involved in cell wall biosynthesis
VRDIPRAAVIPAHNHVDTLRTLVEALAPQVDLIVVVDNASDPPITAEMLGGPSEHLLIHRDEEQPPNLSRLWNEGLECARLWLFDRPGVNKVNGHQITMDRWDVAVFNDDAIVPPGWFDAVATPLREHPTAVVACTPAYGDPYRPPLLKAVPDGDLYNRMTPWAFVTKGEVGLRGDERLRWWWGDTRFDFEARRAGGVLHVPGPQVVNARANQATNANPALGEQAGRDRAMFEQIEGRCPW